MRKRDVRRWARKQYAGDVQPFPRWVRWAVIALAVAVIVGKLLALF